MKFLLQVGEELSVFFLTVLMARLLMLAILKRLDSSVPILIWSFGKHGDRRVRVALKRFSEDGFVGIYGLLLWGFPIFVGFAAYDYVAAHEGSRWDRVVGNTFTSLVFAVWAGIAGLKRSETESEQDTDLRAGSPIAESSGHPIESKDSL